MRVLFFLISFSTLFWARAQVDTLIIEDDPVILTKEVYYAPPINPIKPKLIVSLGFPYSRGYENRNNKWGLFQTEVAVGFEKSAFEFSLGVGYGKYQSQELKSVTETKSNEEVFKVQDTTYSYTLSQTGVYNGETHYDTTWIITVNSRDTTIVNQYDSTYTKPETIRQQMLYIPLSVGYLFKKGKFLFGFAIEGSPLFINHNKKIQTSVVLGLSTKLQYKLTSSWSMGSVFNFREIKRVSSEVSSPNFIFSFSFFATYYFN